MEKLYAKVLYKLAENGKEQSVESLIAHLKRTGRLKLLPRILRAYKEEKERRGEKAVSVEIASKAEEADALAEAKAQGVHVDKAVVNENLIKGFRVRAQGKLIDRSAKRSLIDLYYNIVR